MQASLEQKGQHSQYLLTWKVGWNYRQVINLLAQSLKTPKAVPRISVIIYELMEFMSQSMDSLAELTSALTDPKKL